MEKLVLVVLWGLSLCKGLDILSEKHVPISLEETILGRNRGFCSTWGNGAFRTFDDKFYHFTSTCNYILSRHCASGAEDFNIQIRRGSDGKLEHVFIKIEGVKILLVNGTISVQDAVVRLPYHDKVIGIYKVGIYTQLANRKRTISVNWNNEDALWTTIDDKYQGQLCGLCGNFDKNSSSNYDSSFLNANKLDVLGHTCHSNPSSSQSCEESSDCHAISFLFLWCFDINVLGQYWEHCQADVCSCKGPGCQCATFAEIARHCNKANIANWENWRTQTQCTLPTCPGNQIYKECGPSYLPTCTDPNPQQQSNVCVNTCICPEGKVLDNVRGTNRCITESVCPCEYSGQIYQVGEIRNTSCQSCICESGKWTCSYRHCPGRCTIEEATYFTTFDNTFYSLVGDCSYYAVLTNDWNIEVTIRQCQAAFKQTCLQRVTLIKNQTNIVFNNDGNIYLDGNEVASPLRTGEIIIFWQSSQFIQVATTFGLKMQVQIDPVMQLYISLSDDAKGITKGLCGTFNDDADDDFLSAQGIVESTPITFANSWETEDSCPEATVPSPCISSENEIYAKLHCSHLKDPVGVFSVCHSTVDYMKYYQMCVAATCACENINDCLCAGLGAYVHECAVHGLIIRYWRKDICDKPCPNTQVFENDMRTCNRTCRSLSHYDYTCDVKDTPVYGCGCPEGKYMDNSGECIDKADCSCYMGETVIKKGQSMTLNGRICTCENGKLSCPLIPTTTQPGCLNGKVYNDCTKIIVPGKSKAKTCRSRNIPSSNSLCVPGCACPGNLVEDDSGRCIDPEQCPCLFGGESHKAGTTIKRDCNKCTCRAGVWNCTTNSCPKTCHVHGDGQYLTFDGKRYMFDGNCEYIFVEDYCKQGTGTFQILTENVPCCENGVTCSRNIKILLVGKEFILTDGRVIQSEKSREINCIDSSYSLHTVGLYLILKFSNGITVIWDKRTRVSITLDPRWKNKVCGLCGNFNDDVADDLTTKGNSVVTNVVKFGSSWKSSLSCSDAMNQTFPCDRNPYCLTWAQRKCSIIKYAVFQKCHKKVDPTPFYDACVQEACACDLEGKYLGFCTAVAVYAEACNKAGVCVNWRTPDLCPVYCDYYNSPGECSWHYQPCGTLTTKTCSDHHIGKTFSAILEGCYARCPENAPYLDENKMKCVNLAECTCYYNGIILQPDETTSNDCEECECKNGKVTCRASSKTTVKPTLPLTTTNRIEETTTRIIWETTSTETTQLPVIPSTTKSTTSSILETTPPSERPTTMTSTTSYIPETTTPSERLTTTKSTTSYIPETTTPSERPTTRTSTTSYIPETTLPIRTTTESTTISIPETTTPSERPTTRTSTTSYIPEEECNGEWSPWINDNTPSDINPEDFELLDSIRDDLCHSLSDTINKIQCQFVDYPKWPVSQSIDNVTCDIDTGLVCTFNESGLGGRKFCYDYRIRVCCEPHTVTEWTTTSLPETTSATIIPETTRPIQTTTASTTKYIPETTTSATSTLTTTTPFKTTTPSERPTTRTSTTSYIPETTFPIRTTTESTTISIPETTTPSERPTTRTSTTSYIPETTRPIQTTTASTTKYIPEPYCNGIWSSWFNENTPTIQNKGDSELLETIRYKLCPSSSYKINDIACEAVKFPQRPISETKDNVSCDINEGLICNYNEQTPENHLMCLDYRIRVCCEPILTSQITSTAIVSIIHSTVYEPPITHVTEKPPEPCQCNSNPPRKCLETWKENCTIITCIGGDTFKMNQITCPTLIKPKCINNIEPVKVHTADGCCEKWECDCECEIWGDPHYRSFDGTWYDFFENCTYTLVEERVPKYNFSVLLDNYFCFPFVKKSCPRGLIISYNGNVVHISTGGTYVLTVNGNNVSPPYNANDFIITKLGISTYISIPGIRTTITAYPNAFKIRVPEQYFLNNTQGQCGSCSHSPPQCIRKNGKAEPNDCCHRTAFDWRVQDSRKPYCQSAPTNVPCTPIPPPPTCKPEKTICDLIQSQPFKQCSEKINLNTYLKVCIFDHCVVNSTIDCSSLEAAALACASVGACVDWRPFTNGMCNYTCNQGFVYKPCQSKEDDQCKNATLIAGEALTPTEEGCFCPDGMLLSEDKSRCIAFCQNCRDQFGQPRNEGDAWEDANNPCISYKCTEIGIVIRNMSCNQDESCPESDRVYLDRCCFACRLTQGECKVNKFNETIRSDNCEATFEATQCLGHCSSATRYDPRKHHMDSDCQCCHEDKTESMSVELQCKNGMTKGVEYTSIKSCKCKDCGNTF